MRPALGYVLKQQAAPHPKVSGLGGQGYRPRTGLSNPFRGAACCSLDVTLETVF